jgi:hypothetical protein
MLASLARERGSGGPAGQGGRSGYGIPAVESLGLWASVREWWRWRVRRAGLNIYGVAEFGTTVGTIVSAEKDAWRVEDDEGRILLTLRQPEDPMCNVGDKVEIQPRFQGAIVRWNLAPSWLIVRKR